jgi:imidazole glycerol-phosphate synthase subunit HisF
VALAARIIPRLDIKGPNLVKGIQLEGLRVLGKPDHFARYYYENGADELIYQDVVASLYGRNSLKEIITKTAREVFIPLTVGGGLRNIADVRDVLRAGADKVAINTAAIENPDFISKASLEFGSSTIVVSIEAIMQPDGRYFAFTDNGRNFTGIDAVEWAKRSEELGAGEILLTSVDREGGGHGFDLDFISQVSSAVSIPVIAHGGAGRLHHISDLLSIPFVNSVSLASMIHYAFVEKEKNLIGYEEGNIDFLKSNMTPNHLEKVSISEIKEYLNSNKVHCRTASSSTTYIFQEK